MYKVILEVRKIMTLIVQYEERRQLEIIDSDEMQIERRNNMLVIAKSHIETNSGLLQEYVRKVMNQGYGSTFEQQKQINRLLIWSYYLQRHYLTPEETSMMRSGRITPYLYLMDVDNWIDPHQSVAREGCYKYYVISERGEGYIEKNRETIGYSKETEIRIEIILSNILEILLVPGDEMEDFLYKVGVYCLVTIHHYYETGEVFFTIEDIEMYHMMEIVSIIKTSIERFEITHEQKTQIFALIEQLGKMYFKGVTVAVEDEDIRNKFEKLF